MLKIKKSMKFALKKQEPTYSAFDQDLQMILLKKRSLRLYRQQYKIILIWPNQKNYFTKQ
jgi:hypothetical protein